MHSRFTKEDKRNMGYHNDLLFAWNTNNIYQIQIIPFSSKISREIFFYNGFYKKIFFYWIKTNVFNSTNVTVVDN